MKKILFTIFILVVFVTASNIVYAGGEDYTFSMDYEGGIVAGEQKTGTVTLEGVDSPVQSNVRIKVDITGPATPTILATDSNGTELDIASIGYWGPETGFAVGGTFTNVTPIKATFPVAGSYEVALTLIDANSPNTEYARNVFVIGVDDVANKDNTQTDDSNGSLTDGDEELGAITELPQTGNCNCMYFVSIPLIVIAGILFYYLILKNKK